jgi:peptide/nickel transport system permease protein
MRPLMLVFVLRRIAYSVAVLFGSSVLVFSVVSATRGAAAGIYGTPSVAYLSFPEIVERRHLDEPLWLQYVHWVKEAFTERFGTTLADNRPILDDLGRALGNTLQLILAAELLAVALAVGLGALSALRQYSIFDHAGTGLSYLGMSMPLFWLALIAQVLVVQLYEWTGLRIFPIANLSSVDPGTGLHFWLDRAHHLALPVALLAFSSVAVYSRYVRAAMLEVLNADYVRAARARGLTERRVAVRHALRNALIPLVTVVAINFSTLFGGAIVIETVFSLDGMGLYFINALGTGDTYRVMAWLMLSATAVVVFNLVADVVYAVLDPRIRIS